MKINPIETGYYRERFENYLGRNAPVIKFLKD